MTEDTDALPDVLPAHRRTPTPAGGGMTRDSIRALMDAATPGPWEYPCIVEPGSRFGGDCGGIRPSMCMGHDYDLYGSIPDNDRAFVAASRTAVPLLLAVADAAAAFIAHEVDWDDRDNPYYVYTGIDADAVIGLNEALAALEATR